MSERDLDALKARIDLHDLAARLGLERPAGNGNYRSPQHEDTSPSLSIFSAQAGGQRWKDFSTDAGGTAIDLVMYAHGVEFGEALKLLREWYGMPLPERQAARPQEESLPEYIARRCVRGNEVLRTYLCEQRKVAPEVVARCEAAGTLAYNDWRSPTKPAGTAGHGGPAVASIIREAHGRRVVAVDMRYLDPALNGGVKAGSQGEKAGRPWVPDPAGLRAAETVVIVESAINALSVLSAAPRRHSALAIRGTGGVAALDLRWLQGKRAVICMDNDAPDPDGRRPGAEAAWRLYELLVSQDVAARLVDQSDWELGQDLNDVLVARGAQWTAQALQRYEMGALPGVAAAADKRPPGRQRLYLPAHDLIAYGNYRVQDDMTRCIGSVGKDEQGEPRVEWVDCAGFRIAAVRRIRVAAPESALTGETHVLGKVLFSVHCQVPGHGTVLQKRVMTDEQMHSRDHWQRIGWIYAPGKFARLASIMERSALEADQSVVNFVGLCWKDGRLVVNEGPDTYFSDPEKQCPYARLTFPRGDVADARRVVEAYGRTMRGSMGLIVLSWALGAHLKAITGFWPHMVLQGEKNSGKSTFMRRLCGAVGMRRFGGQSLATEYRILTSMSSTSQPVLWEEFSAQDQRAIDRAISMLQESYDYTVTRRGSEQTEYLQCAPSLIAGEDAPVDSLLGKLVRLDISGAKGTLLPEDLPAFPVHGWLEFLARQRRGAVLERVAQAEGWLQQHLPASDDSAQGRIARNYGAVLAAWGLLCEWAGIDAKSYTVPGDMARLLGSYLAETKADREPWVWVLDILFSEMAARRFSHPYALEMGETGLQLCLRPSHVIDHIRHSSHLRQRWDAMPVKSDRVFSRQLAAKGIISGYVERQIEGRRYGRLAALDVAKMEQYGLLVPIEQL